MSYEKTAPRDIFNEANFMMNIGKLALLTIDGKFDNLTFDEKLYSKEGITFDIDWASGDLVIKQKLFHLNGEHLELCRGLNSRDSFSMCYIDEGNEDDTMQLVFDAKGEPSLEFLEFVGQEDFV